MRIETITVPYFSENCYIMFPEGSDKCLVVDPGCGALSEIRECVQSAGYEVGAVLCTHGHADHYWEAADVAGSAPVYIPGPDFSQLTPDLRDPADQARYLERLPEYKRPENPVSLDDWAVDDAFEPVPGVKMRMVPAPGHTPGSALFLFQTAGPASGYIGVKADAFWNEWREISQQASQQTPADETVRLYALAGDVIFAGSVGRTDLPRGDQKQMLHSLRTLQNVIDPNTVLLPGHGDITVMGWEMKNNQFLVQARYQG